MFAVPIASLTPDSYTTAQQEAQRAQFLVEKAKQEQRQKIVQAEGEAEAAKMISCLKRVRPAPGVPSFSVFHWTG